MTSLSVQTWLVDTLLWTGVLMALVMVLRRPVSRGFGPGLAYALWLLPLLRMVMPPLTLPVTQAQAPAAAPFVVPVLASEPGTGVAAAAPAAVTPFDYASVDYAAPLIALWLAGALAFLLWRFTAYHAMRRRVLAGATQIARIGAVRVVESVEVSTPVAFGVLDKVVALPRGFAAQADRTARNLALRHELQHHDGGDILLNMAMQPLFALHWFNPLSWLAWRALRCDQEAACDARVLSGESSAEREGYARLIAGFAAGARDSRPLPLACPVAGEKSIIHRLRSLTMSEPSRPRRLAGRSLVAIGAFALPLTATVTYAQMAAPDVPDAPEPPAAPAAPVAPVAPAAPAAPRAPEPPAPPAPVKGEQRVVMIERHDGKSGGKMYTREVERDGKRYVVKTDTPMSDAEFERQMADVDRQVADATRQADQAARQAARIEVDTRRITADAQRQADHALAVAEVSVCSGGAQGYDFSTSKGGDRDQRVAHIRVCAMGKAREGLTKARQRIAADPKMDPAIKRDVLRAMDHEIAGLDRES